MLLLNAQPTSVAFRTRHVLCVGMQNVPVMVMPKNVLDGNLGLTCAHRASSIPIGKPRHLHAVAQWGCGKKSLTRAVLRPQQLIKKSTHVVDFTFCGGCGRVVNSHCVPQWAPFHA